MLSSSAKHWIDDLLARLRAATRHSDRTRRRYSLGLSQAERLEARRVLSVTISDASLVEPLTGQAMMEFTVTRSGDLSRSLEVSYITVDGSAVAGEDYVASPSGASVLFSVDSDTATISVPIIGDGIAEQEESFQVVLTGFVGLPATLSPHTTFATNTGPTSVASGDFNLDGKSDLLIGHVVSNIVSVLLNTADVGAATPAFSQKQDLDVAGRPHGVAVGDFNGDGKPDIAAVTAYNNDVAVLLNATDAGSTTVSFLTAERFTVGNSPSQLTVADVNGDGKPDIVTISDAPSGGNSTPGFVRILLNTTDTGSDTVSFAAVQTFDGPVKPRSVTVADFNGDGKPDIAASGNYRDSNDNSVSVLLNTTDAASMTATFAPKLDLPAGDLVHHLASGDVNADGKPDLIASSFNDRAIYVFTNLTATGGTEAEFAERISLSTPQRPEGVVLVDLTLDGRPEIVATNRSGGSSLASFTNTTGTAGAVPTFGQPVTFNTGQAPVALVAVDLNLDSFPDLAVTNSSGNSVSVFLNMPPRFARDTAVGTILVGDGTAPPVIGGVGGTISYEEKTPPHLIAPWATVSDPDNLEFDTGVLTVAISENAEATDRIQIRNQGTNGGQIGVSGSDVLFEGQVIGTFAGTTVLEITLNAGATPQAVQSLLRNITFVSLADSPSALPRTLAVTLSDGDGQVSNTPTKVVEIVRGQALSRVMIADSSLVEPFGGPQMMVFTLTRTGDVSRALEVAFQTQDGSAVAGEDYVATSGTVIFSVGNSTTTVSVPILDDDIAEEDETFSLVLSSLIQPPPNLSPRTSLPTEDGPTIVGSADFNLDGKPDLLSAHNLSNWVSVLLNRTSDGGTVPVFAAKQDLAITGRPQGVAVADFNGDGKPDIAAVTAYDNDVAVVLNATDPGAETVSFLDIHRFPVGNSPFQVTVADINGDGRPDIITTSNPGFVKVLLNTTEAGSTTPSFAAVQTFDGPTNTRSVTVADFNGDGKPDVAASGNYLDGNGNSVSVLLNTTDVDSMTATFAPKLDLPAGDLAQYLTSGDVNGDGTPDLVVSSFNDSSVYVFANLTTAGASTVSFADRVVLTTVTRPSGVLLVDLTADGRPDLAVANRSDGANSISVFANSTSTPGGMPSFLPSFEFTVEQAPESLVSADFNGDMRPDLAVANGSGDNVSVLLNDPTMISGDSATGTILDDGAEPPTISISDVTVVEGDSGETPLEFTVTLSRSSLRQVTVDYATADDSATTADNDYTAATGTLTFEPGITSQTVTVIVNGDTTIEPDEQFFVDLLNPINATILESRGTGTISNDDIQIVTLDIDGNNATDVFTDGILIARYLVGFRGQTLINNAIGPGAGRTDPLEISALLGGALDMLDADGNGELDVFTDGILIARFLVGFRGQALISQAIGPNATRTTADAVSEHLSQFLPQPPAASAIAFSRAAPAPALFGSSEHDAVAEARRIDEILVWFANQGLL